MSSCKLTSAPACWRGYTAELPCGGWTCRNNFASPFYPCKGPKPACWNSQALCSHTGEYICADSSPQDYYTHLPLDTQFACKQS